MIARTYFRKKRAGSDALNEKDITATLFWHCRRQCAIHLRGLGVHHDTPDGC